MLLITKDELDMSVEFLEAATEEEIITLQNIYRSIQHRIKNNSVDKIVISTQKPVL